MVKYDITHEEYEQLGTMMGTKNYNSFYDFLKLPREIRKQIEAETEQEIKELKKAGKCNDFITEANIYTELIKSKIEKEKQFLNIE